MDGGPSGLGSRRKDSCLDFTRTFRCLNCWSFRVVSPNVRWKTWRWITVQLIFHFVARSANSHPVSSSSINKRSSSDFPQTINDNPELVRYWNPLERYLTKYGYLTQGPSSVIGGGNLRKEDQLRESIAMMQRFGNIPETGKIDSQTISLLHKRRCGIPDIIGGPSERVRRYAIQGQKWPYTNLTYSIRDWPPNIDSSMVRRELSKAFKVWSDASKLEFEEVRSQKADIVISFLHGDHNDGYPFDGRGIVLAHAFFPGEGIGGDAHFDAEEPWVHGEPSPNDDGVSLFAVAAHEFGHSLGLSHSSVTGSLMNPFYQSIKDNFQLPRDDTFGIQQLYGSRNPVKWAPISPYDPRFNPGRDDERTTKAPRYRPSNPTSRYYPPRTTQRPRTGPPTRSEPSPKPHNCNTTFDAISIIRTELFIFKDKYFWRLNNKGLMKDYPVEIRRFWYDADLDKIDAVYERPIDTKIVFFSGKQYWLFNGNVKEPGYPRPLTDLGLPPTLSKIDAVMVWGFNGKTYLFSGKQYWRYDEFEGRVELDYPRDMSTWRGVPNNIDAAFQHTDSHTYFFKNRKFWRFNDFLMRVQSKKPGNINEYWFGCPSKTEQMPQSDDYEDDDDDDGKDSRFIDEFSGSQDVRVSKANAVMYFCLVVTFTYFRILS